MRVAIVTVVHGRHEHLRLQQTMIARSTRPVERHILVAMGDPELRRLPEPPVPTTVIDLPADPDDLPLAAARNAGAAAALELGADLLVFLDVDCLPDPDLVAGYADAASAAGASLCCGSVAYLPRPPGGGYDLDRLAQHPSHPARPALDAGRLQRHGDPRLFWSLSFATTAAVWRQVGGFHEGYRGYGAEDTDFAYRAAVAGVSLTWVGGARAYHQWHPVSSPPAEHLDAILRNGALFAQRWGWWPMEDWLAAFAEQGLIRADADAGWVLCRTGVRGGTDVRGAA